MAIWDTLKRELDKAEYLLRQVVAETDRFADVFDMLGGSGTAVGSAPMARGHRQRTAVVRLRSVEIIELD